MRFAKRDDCEVAKRRRGDGDHRVRDHQPQHCDEAHLAEVEHQQRGEHDAREAH